MPELNSAPEAASEEQNEKAPEESQQQTESADTANEVEKWRSLARKHETRAKENAEKAKAYDELMESQKSEQQKLQEAKEAAERAASEAASELARMRAAVKFGLSEEDLELLDGVQADQVEQRAQRIAERLGSKSSQFPDLAQGRGNSGVTQLSPNDLIRAAARRR